jgi:hypothetical protein
MMTKRKPSLAYDLRELPARVADNLRGRVSADRFIVAAPTEYRPNPDMPFAWLVLTADQLVLCCTHRTRGVYAAHPFEEINQVRLESNGRVLRILLNDPASGDLTIPLHPNLSPEQIEAIVRATHSR